MVLVFVLFLFAWTTVFMLLGIQGLQRHLGGTVIFFYLLPIIPMLKFKQKYRVLSTVLWALVVFIIFIEIVNYLSMWFIYNQDVIINKTFETYMLAVPLILMASPYDMLIELCFNICPTRIAIIYEVPKLLRQLAGVSISAFIITIAMLFPLMIKPINILSNVYASGYVFGLFAFILGSVWLFVYIRDIDNETLL